MNNLVHGDFYVAYISLDKKSVFLFKILNR